MFEDCMPIEGVDTITHELAARIKLAEAMGWKWVRVPIYETKGNWITPDGTQLSLYETDYRYQQLPNPYESEADNAELIEYISKHCSGVVISWFESPENWQVAIQRSDSVKWLSVINTDRKTAIIECAAEALGIPLSSQDGSES